MPKAERPPSSSGQTTCQFLVDKARWSQRSISFLVLPHEWTKNNPEFVEIDLTNAEHTAGYYVNVRKNTYKHPRKLLFHLRNALAHGRLTQEKRKIIFRDKWGDQEFEGRISLLGIGNVLQALNVAIDVYVRDEIASKETLTKW